MRFAVGGKGTSEYALVVTLADLIGKGAKRLHSKLSEGNILSRTQMRRSEQLEKFFPNEDTMVQKREWEAREFPVKPKCTH